MQYQAVVESWPELEQGIEPGADDRRMRLRPPTVLALALATAGGAAAPTLAPLNLLFATKVQVEYQPAGSTPMLAALVDVARPRFSWQLASRDPAARDQEQQAYEIVVRELLPDGTERDVSDSYQVWTSDSLNQALGCYTSASPGCITQLYPDRTYAVRVRIWSGPRGAPRQQAPPPSTNYSEPVYFGTALGLRDSPGASGKPTVWAAPWITAPTERNQLLLAFELPDKPIARARVYAATAGYSALFVNGARVNAGGDELGPWTSWSVRVLYRGYDVTLQLESGDNLLGVWLGLGQYGRYGHNYWNPDRDHSGMPLAHELPRSCAGCSSASCVNRTQVTYLTQTILPQLPGVFLRNCAWPILLSQQHPPPELPARVHHWASAFKSTFSSETGQRWL